MTYNKDFIKRTQYYNHSLKLLKDIIINIEAYPEIDQINKLYTSDNYDKKLAEKNKEIANKIIKESNLDNIKEEISQIEELLINNDNNITNQSIIKKIEYLNDYHLENIYHEEKTLMFKKFQNMTQKLENDLKKLNKEIPLYIEITNTKNGYSITETINNKLTIGELFKIVSIEKIIKDLKLENNSIYVKSESDDLQKDCFNLYPSNKENTSKLRKKLYPELRIIKKIKKKENKESSLLKEGYLVADLLIIEKQLKDLLKNLSTKDYKNTVAYLNKTKHIITSIISTKQKKIFQAIKKELPKLNFSKNDYSSLEKEILNVSLENSEQEFKEILNYENNSLLYQEILKEDLENYQQNAIKKEYNLDLSSSKIKKLKKQL